MPIKPSAKKYMRVTERKTLRNKIVKGTVKGAIKKTREAVKTGALEDAQTWLKNAIKSIDKAAQKKILKKNTAARKKSRLNALVKKLAMNPLQEIVKKATKSKKVLSKKKTAKKAAPKKVAAKTKTTAVRKKAVVGKAE
jgi:small subunit ribosomal protein S20